jgi:hypothetical protein
MPGRVCPIGASHNRFPAGKVETLYRSPAARYAGEINLHLDADLLLPFMATVCIEMILPASGFSREWFFPKRTRQNHGWAK